MIRYRPFRNCDPPALAEIWRSQPRARGLVQPMTAALLDDLVLAKPYFDRHGLIVAVDGEQPVGFAHAGFGSSADGSSLDYESGAICQLLIKHEIAGDAEIAAGLLTACEGYLRQRGVRLVYGGGTNQLAPFYLGLYGGSQLPGVLASDQRLASRLRKAGYAEFEKCTVFERQMAGFRPAMDRQFMQLRRRHQVISAGSLCPTNWWDACHWGQRGTTTFEISGWPSGQVHAATYWDLEPLASSWGSHAMGLWDLTLPDDSQRELLAAYLLGESMRGLQSQGISLVEVQAHDADRALREACVRLGFREVDQGILFSKHD